MLLAAPNNPQEELNRQLSENVYAHMLISMDGGANAEEIKADSGATCPVSRCKYQAPRNTITSPKGNTK